MRPSSQSVSMVGEFFSIWSWTRRKLGAGYYAENYHVSWVLICMEIMKSQCRTMFEQAWPFNVNLSHILVLQMCHVKYENVGSWVETTVVRYGSKLPLVLFQSEGKMWPSCLSCNWSLVSSTPQNIEHNINKIMQKHAPACTFVRRSWQGWMP